MKVYGITNCNTVKKVLDWLKANHINYEFHDFKKLGISADKLQEWDAKAGYEKFMNKQGLTWKQLDPQIKASMIKRPVIEQGDLLFFGFDEDFYRQHFK